jgi:NADH-quinone oxidoreductase subunit G
MEGARDGIPPTLNSRYSAPGWNSVQALTTCQTEPGGPLSGGESGRRLIEPHPGKPFAPIAALPEPHAAAAGEWLVVPMQHLYGSEELSMLSPAIAACSPKPTLDLCAGDATGLNLADGDAAEIGPGVGWTLPCRIVEGLPAGCAGLPTGFPGLPVLEMPCRITIRKAGGGA